MKRTISILLFALIGLFSFGCQTNTLPPAVGPDSLAAGTYPQIVAIGSLDRFIVAAAPIVQPADGQTPMHVTVPLRSVAKSTINVQYRFEFQDKTGRPMRTTPGWRFMPMEPNVQVHMQGSAIDTAATTWRLQIRPAR